MEVMDRVSGSQQCVDMCEGGLKCVYFNARSIRNKVDELAAWISTWEFDVVAISETWIEQGQEWLLQVPGFRCFNQSRVGGRRGGGVALLVKESITVVERTFDVDSNVEVVWAEIRNRKGEVTLLGVFYRPPKSSRDVEERIAKMILDRSESSRVVVMGDFNFTNIDWNSYSSSTLEGSVFVQCVQEGFLTQYVDRPTRGETTLDLVLGNEPDQVLNLEVGEHFGDSDHNSVTFTLVMERDRCIPKGRSYCWGKGNYEAIRRDLGHIGWSRKLQGLGTTEMWSLFKEQLLRVLDKYVPVRQGGSGRVREPWCTKEVESLVKRKKVAYVKMRREGSVRALESYKLVRKELKRVLRRARRGHEKTLAGRIKENPKAFYRYVRNKRLIRARLGPVKDRSGKLCVEPEEMGEALNEYFSSVFTQEKVIVVEENSDSQAFRLDEIEVHKEEVLALLESMKIDKSPGPDGIYPRILWEAREEIAEPLALIFRSSLASSIVPEDWRIANVVPLFKKGSRDHPGNYRPVSLTSVVGKVLERIIRDRIYDHLERNKLIGDSQHGFVRGKSCLTNLIEFFEKVTKEVDKGKAVDVVYMDFSKAFDKVPHGRLLQKIRMHGIEGDLAVWIENWLADRRQRVVVDGKYSSWSSVTSGVPQGSVLGPLLFVIFINDLDEGVEGWVSKFADDTKVGGVVDSEDGCYSLQRDIDRLHSWAERWQMEFNAEKCEVIHFGKSNRAIEYRANGRTLGSVDEQRDLGVYVHRSLKVGTQVDKVVKKAYGVLAFIGRGIEFRSRDIMLQLYKTLVRPHLEYCVQFWSPHYKKDVEALERVQRRFTRMLPGMVGRSYEERLRDLRLFSLERRRLRGDLIETYKMIRGLDRVDSESLFPRMGMSTTRGHSFKLRGDIYRTDVRGRFFTQRVVKVWNALPATVVDSPTLRAFKWSLDRHMESIGIV